LTKDLVLYLERAKSEPPQEFIDYFLCKEFRWTYRDLMETPRFFVEKMILMADIKNKYDIKRNHG